MNRSSKKSILLTGGLGYIGSHACVALIQHGYEPFIVDNLSNSNPTVLDRIARITGHRPMFYKNDMRDGQALENIFRDRNVDAVIHFAGLKAVGESTLRPYEYYSNNVQGSLSLFGAMQKAGVARIVFSSSATVYGTPDSVPISEEAPVQPVNPYGRTKAITESVLRDMHAADSNLHVGILRYFNPVGAHESGLIGEDPMGTPNNLMPYIAQVAVGRRMKLQVFGNDYPTPDGTGIRDYVHVMDLAEGHVAALNSLDDDHNYFVVNLGTGRGYSVLEVVKAFEKATGRAIPYDIAAKRPGDIAAYYADVSKSHQVLRWRAERNLEQMCTDTWRWQSANPDGYSSVNPTGLEGEAASLPQG